MLVASEDWNNAGVYYRGRDGEEEQARKRRREKEKVLKEKQC
jgi:hypothetical protein